MAASLNPETEWVDTDPAGDEADDPFKDNPYID
jgi:hypothetical protein